MKGTNTTNLIVGSMEVCVDSESRAMCHDGWGFGNARDRCPQKEADVIVVFVEIV